MMNSEGVAMAPTTLAQDSDPAAIPRSDRGIWAWVSIACVLLLASWGVRKWQDQRFSQDAGYIEECPFPLKMISTKLGVWRVVEGGELSLDKQTARITGCTEYVMRSYLDESTGVSLGVLVLFGPAEPVLPHTPQVCYPATGFTEIEESIDRTIKGEDGRSYVFRTAVYGKPGGRSFIREEAYHSFRLEGSWSPNAGLGRKFPRRNPGVFKVQIQRLVAAGEHRGQDNPIEQFLALLVPEIERLIREKHPVTGESKPISTTDAKNSTGNPAPTTTNREAAAADTVAFLAGDADRDAGRSVAGSTDDRADQAGRHADEADQQDQQQDRREVDDHRQVYQASNRVGSPPIDLGHRRVPAISAFRHPRRSSESNDFDSGREDGKGERFVQPTIHDRPASGQVEFAARRIVIAAKTDESRTRAVSGINAVVKRGNMGRPGHRPGGFLVDRDHKHSLE